MFSLIDMILSIPKYSPLKIKDVIWYIVLFVLSVYEIDIKGIIVLLGNSYVSVLTDTFVFVNSILTSRAVENWPGKKPSL